jgi:xylulokinase
MMEQEQEHQKCILTVDLGTSGPKVSLYSVDAQAIGNEFMDTPVELLEGGGAEQDPEVWWSAICAASRKLLARRLVPLESIVAVCCTSQWSGTVAVDEQGRHLHQAIIWMDSRGAPYVREITGGFPKISGYSLGALAKWLPITGGIPGLSGKDPIAHILFLKHERPDIYQRTYKFLEPKDYLNLRLTGICAASYDSIALHWVTDNRDLSKVRYHPGLIRRSGVDAAKLPDLKRSVDILGGVSERAAAELGLPTKQRIDVVMGTPDLQSAAVGSGAVKDYEGHLYIGTSSWLTCHMPYKKTDVATNMTTLPSAIPERYFIANEQESAGACLKYVRDNILYADDEFRTSPPPEDYFAVFDRIAERVPAGSNRLIFLPWLYGERTPIEDHTVRGGFYNQSLQTKREHMLRAVLEGVAFNTRWLLNAVEKFIKRPFEAIHMIGGGANSAVWCQIHSDVLNRAIKQVEDPIQANSRGAACLAAVALGFMRFEDIGQRVRIQKTYTPNSDHRAVYDAMFQEFVRIYKANRKIFARLNHGG